MYSGNDDTTQGYRMAIGTRLSLYDLCHSCLAIIDPATIRDNLLYCRIYRTALCYTVPHSNVMDLSGRDEDFKRWAARNIEVYIYI